MLVNKVNDKLYIEATPETNTRLSKLPCVHWDKINCVWVFPLLMAPMLEATFPQMEWAEDAAEVLQQCKKNETAVSQLKSGTIPLEIPKGSFLMNHQEKCRQIAQVMDKYAFYCDVGTGKTILAYAIMNDNRSFKWMVISPRSIIRTAWVQDGKDFFPHLKVLPVYSAMRSQDYKEIAAEWGCIEALKGLRAPQVPLRLMDFADVVVTNVELFKEKDYLKEWNFEGMVVDEASIMRNKDTQSTKALLKALANCKKGYLLSGKPAPNTELEYFPQMEAVNPTIFGTSFYAFRNRYFEAKDWFQRDWKLQPAKRDLFSKNLAKGCIFIKKEDCLDLPEVMPPVIREIHLSGEALKYYRDMEKAQVLLLTEQDKALLASTKLAAMMKLRQITSGFVIDTEDDSKVLPLHSAKINELRDTIIELGDNKAVIWINFKAEVEAIGKLLESLGKSYVTAYSGTKNTDNSIEKFQKNEAQFIIAHPKTLKYGVTFTGRSMVKNCTYAIYYSMSYSYEDYYQSYHRIYRKGQTERCTYIYLVVNNSIDEDIYDAIVNKGQDAAVIENLVRRFDSERK